MILYFVAQRIQQMRESLKQKMEANKIAAGTSDINQRIDDVMSRNLDQMEQLRSKMESMQSRMDSLKDDLGSGGFANNPYYIRMKELQERNRTTLSLMQNGEDQLRNAQERQKAAAAALKDRVSNMRNSAGGMQRSSGSNLRAVSLPEHEIASDSSLQERIKDAQAKNQEAARAIQMQRIRDQQQSRRNY
jgi:hypothetical protein